MCIVLPFVLHAMPVKLVPDTKQSEESIKRTESFLQLTQSVQARQNNIGTITDIIEQIITFIQPHKPIADLKQLISLQPTYYLRVLETLDLALATGRFPCRRLATNADDSQMDNIQLPEGYVQDSSELFRKARKSPNTLGLMVERDESGSLETSMELSEYGLCELDWPTSDSFFDIGAETINFPLQGPFLHDMLSLCRD